ncbi:MAG: HpcH/HpaI aldolase/citrate lyase family protein [Victivallaceae bacterium]
MRTSNVLQKLRAGEPVFCLKSTYAQPEIVELMGKLGADVVWICNEHLDLSSAQRRSVMCAGRAAGVDILFRRSYNGYSGLIRLLEMGCAGLMIPHCKSAAMAAEIVRETKFYPLGTRGFDGSGADSDYGTRPLAEYMAHANRETFLMMQIEDAEAIDQIEAIAAVPGIDLIFIGPADLSHSLGCPGDLKNPRIREVITRTVRACKANGIYCGTAGLDIAYTRELLELGVKFITGQSEYSMIRESTRTVLADISALFSASRQPQ